MVLLKRLGAHWLSMGVHLAGLAPLLYLGWAARQGIFWIDPTQHIMSITGKAALILLLLSLVSSPIRALTGWRVGGRAPMVLGMYATFYAGLHLAAFVGLDYRFDLQLLRSVLLDSPPVWAGIGAGLILLQLTVTSTQGWQRRLGKNWKRRHRMVYLAGALIVIYFWGVVKDSREPLGYAAILVLFLVLRLPLVRQAVSRLIWSRATSSSNVPD